MNAQRTDADWIEELYAAAKVEPERRASDLLEAIATKSIAGAELYIVLRMAYLAGLAAGAAEHL